MPKLSLAPLPRFLLSFVALIGVFYAAVYFPYERDTVPADLLIASLKFQTRLAGGLLWLFDRSVSVQGDLILGRVQLQMVLDCAAIDAQSLFAATVLAFPAPWRRKVLGLAAGIVLINLINLARIAILYGVGVRWPQHFDLLHEDLLQFVIIATAAAAFAVWVSWARRAPAAEAAASDPA